ncbi:MAG: hypothetical protein JNK45_35605, partial [Myxococcales bacterium]|nr:hypothetical protein [Myxococcales bacterium]
QRQLNGIHTQLTLIDRETGELARQREIDDDPQRAVFVQYLSAGMQLAKSFLVETLYMLSRSTDYYALTRTPLDLADFRVSALEKQYGETLEQLRKATVEVGSRAEVLCTHVIDDPVRLAALRSGATAWLSLRPTAGGALASPFANLQRPLVHRVQCFLEGAASPRAGAYATIAVEHGGISYVHDVASDSLWSFSHCPITTAFQYWLDDPRRELIDGDGREVTRSGDLTEGGRFMMPSPFAQWGLRIRPGDGENATLDLSRLARVVVRFWTKGKVAGLAASA